MSIYATLWEIQFENPETGDWVGVTAQAVPAHIDGEHPYLPPAIPEDSPIQRAVVFVTEDTEKGTERSGQEYRDPLLVITGEEYVTTPFPAMLDKLYEALGW